VAAARAGDQTAWDALVDRFAQTVWTIARSYRLNASDAADVSQTTWLRLVEHLDRIEQPERVGAWLATTARRESLRLLRQRSRQVLAGEDFDERPDPSPTKPPEHGVTVQERRNLVQGLVQQLPDRSQVLIRSMSTESQLSYREISDALGMPIGSIGPTRARALGQLRRLATQAGIDQQDVIG
jgi:RNA polymerase sigma factor (sigma-70 family)